MRTSALLAVLLLASGVSIAGQERMRLVHPKGTALKLSQLKRENDLSAEFVGRVWVSGTFVGRWPTGATDLQYKAPDYLLIPDPSSVANLPYFSLHDPPYLNHYRVTSIELVDGEQALRKAVGDIAANRLLERRVDRVRATGAFLVEAYVVGVECDAPWARAKLLEARLPEQLASAHRTVPEGC